MAALAFSVNQYDNQRFQAPNPRTVTMSLFLIYTFLYRRQNTVQINDLPLESEVRIT